MLSMYEVSCDGVTFDSAKNMFTEIWQRVSAFNNVMAAKAGPLIWLYNVLSDIRENATVHQQQPVHVSHLLGTMETLRVNLELSAHELKQIWIRLEKAWEKFDWLIGKFMNNLTYLKEPSVQIACEWLSKHHKMEYIKKVCLKFFFDFKIMHGVIKECIETFQLQSVVSYAPLDDSCYIPFILSEMNEDGSLTLGEQRHSLY